MPSRPAPKHTIPPAYKVGLAALGLILIGAGFVGGYAARPAPLSSSQAIRLSNNPYTLVDPLLAVSRTYTGDPSSEYRALDSSVQKYIDTQKATGNITTASVYFINYGKGGSFGINENDAYDPASLLKVVVMVAYLKEADTDPSVLDQTITYTQALANYENVPFATPSELTIGQTYTVSDLIDKMIEDSDNGAMDMLIDSIDPANLNIVYSDLGVPAPGANSADYTISAKDYSLFFRVLYNATYLSWDNSQKALSILSQATFKDGLVAGLPAGTVVAHKFGEHVTGDANGNATDVELHDCGIVYGTGGPYLLCVMTRGTSLSAVSSLIAGISTLVHNNVSGQ